MKKFALLTLLSGLLLTAPVYAQSDEGGKTIIDFVPGILLTPQERANLDESKIEKNVFPTSKYSSFAMTEDELFQYYDDGDYKRVVFGLLRLARQGNARAEETIGLMYRFGQGLNKDNKQALRWLSRAAQEQRPLSQHHLGSMYYTGQGVNADMLKAAMWMELAAKNYPPGPNKEQAISDLKNIKLRLSRIEQEEARSQARRYLRMNPVGGSDAVQNTGAPASE